MDGVVGTIVWGLLTGIVVGPLARLVLPGKQNISLLITILLGAVGAIVGDLIYSALGGAEDTAGVDWIQWIVRIGVAAIAVILYGMTERGKSTAT
jgi:uncharacterized membrane protein YeaQ/YmgE (transglycosylase-associated protein family)